MKVLVRMALMPNPDLIARISINLLLARSLGSGFKLHKAQSSKVNFDDIFLLFRVATLNKKVALGAEMGEEMALRVLAAKILQKVQFQIQIQIQ